MANAKPTTIQQSQVWQQPTLEDLGVTNPNSLDSKLAAAYLTLALGIKTSPKSLAVYRHQGIGPAYRKVRSRVFYSVEALDEYAQGIPVKIYQPSIGKSA